MRKSNLLLLLVGASSFVPQASACIVDTGDYCITCKTPAGVIISTLEADWCPGGDAGLVILKGLNQNCQVNYMSPDIGPPHQPNCGVPISKQSAAKGVGPYDLRSPVDRLVAFAPTGTKKSLLLAYRPGTGAAIVVEIQADSNHATFHSTLFARPDTGKPPYGIGSFDLRRPEDRVVAIKDDLLLAYRPGSGNAAVVQFQGDHFDTLYSGMGIGGFDLMGANDQVVALAPNLLLAYRPGSGNSAVVFFADGKFHSSLQTAGVGSFDLMGESDRVVPLGDQMVLAYRSGAGKREWAIVRYQGGEHPHFETILAKANAGIGSFDLQGAEDVVVPLGKAHHVFVYRPGSANSAVVFFDSGQWHSPFSGTGVGAFALDDPNGRDRVTSVATDLLLAYRPGTGAVTLARFNGTAMDTLFSDSDAPKP